MVPYYGKHGAKQYIHGKPIKFGYKMWVAATRLGYVIQLFPYQGAGTIHKELGLGGPVVDQLVSKLSKDDGNCYHIIFDNFFTGMTLLCHLKEKYGFAATGTIRSNRKGSVPQRDAKKMEKEKRGSYDSVLDKDTGICITRWKDSKVVTMASTYAGVNPIKKAQRYSKAEKKRVEITQPNVVAEYNYGMGGVDRFDQNIAAYMITQRSKKWWWPVFRFCVDLAVQNAYQIYRLQARGVSKKLDSLGFRRAIVEVYSKKYIKDSSGLFKHPQMCESNEVRYDNVGHWIKKATQQRCQNKPCKCTTLYCCEKCTVALDPECFKAYHTC